MSSMIVVPKCSKPPPGPNVTQLPSLLLLSRVCPLPSASEFSSYPKVAVPCSVRTEALTIPNANCARIPDPIQRFMKYQRYQPPIPCQPLPQSANMAGISQPSTRECNVYRSWER